MFFFLRKYIYDIYFFFFLRMTKLQNDKEYIIPDEIIRIIRVIPRVHSHNIIRYASLMRMTCSPQ